MNNLVRRGFTLIELLIVIAIIAVIAAIAIPGLLASQRASNERNASASLKSVCSSQSDFRSGDRDGNKMTDFWCADVAGLYGVCPPDSSDPVRLLELSLAGADHNALDQGATAPAATATTGIYTGQAYYSTRSAKAGYWFRAIATDEYGTAYATASGSSLGLTGAYFNNSRFGVECYPDSRMAGRNIFIVSEGNTIFKRALTSLYVVPASNATLQNLAGTNTVLSRFPVESLLRSDYGKLD